MQSHLFQYTYDPAIGYTMKMHHITDGGTFTCSSGPPNDSSGNEIHFDVNVYCELNKCSITDILSNGVSSNITASNINVTLSKLRPSKRDIPRSNSLFLYTLFCFFYCCNVCVSPIINLLFFVRAIFFFIFWPNIFFLLKP